VEVNSLSEEGKVEAAIRKKEQGNLFHKGGKYMRALEKYVTALSYFIDSLDLEKSKDLRLQLNLNIAQSSLQLKKYEDVIFYCNKVTKSMIVLSFLGPGN
jgi:FK506-binding protein 4/5